MTPLYPLLLPALLLLGTCAGTQQSASRADAARQVACRQRADEIYLQQNRDAVYQSDRFAASTRDAPYAGAGLPGTLNRGLPQQYDRDTLMTNCLNGTGGTSGTTTDVVPLPGAPPPPPHP